MQSTNELQTISKTGNTVTLSNGGALQVDERIYIGNEYNTNVSFNGPPYGNRWEEEIAAIFPA